MLKTNSKIVQQRIGAYIMSHFRPYDEDTDNPAYDFTNIGCVCQYIWNVFLRTTYSCENDYRFYNNNIYAAFEYWLGGLPGVIDPEYYYRTSAVDTLGDILEQTAEQRSKYYEFQSEQTLTYLIFNFLRKHVENPYGND